MKNKYISLLDESGRKVDFEIIEMLEMDEKTYAVLMPLKDNEEEGVLVFEVIDTDEQILQVVDDEEIMQKVIDDLNG